MLRVTCSVTMVSAIGTTTCAMVICTTALPTGRAGGLIDGLLAIWPYGIPVLAYRSKARFDPDVTFRLLAKHGATVGLYPATALKVLREGKRPRGKVQFEAAMYREWR